MPAVPHTSSLPPPGLVALGLAILLALLVRGAVGATGCAPAPAPAAGTTSTVQCIKAVTWHAKSQGQSFGCAARGCGGGCGRRTHLEERA